MILLDYSSVMMSSLMVRINDYKDDTNLIRHLIMNQIRRYNLEHREEYGEMILCMDHTKNWRKETFPQYKASRRKSRKDDDKNWTEIFEMLNEIREDIAQRSPFKVLRVEGCEADDIIGTICETNNNPEPILIISPDKDFIQLQRYPNVKQWSNLQKKWVEPDADPVTDLELKVLQGDAGDGVPNVLSPDEVFVDGEKQGRLTKQKKEALLELKQRLSDALLNFEGKGLTVEQRNGKVYVSMENKLLFKSGSWNVGSEGQRALGQLGIVLAENPDIVVMIEGHTDNVPFSPKNTLESNWDLSTKRATSVVTILLKNELILPQNLTAAGRSEYLPIAPNSNVDGRAANRRIEVILSPQWDEINALLNN